MSHIYAGNPAGNFVGQYTYPDDGDGPPKVADVNVFGKGLADDVARLNARTSGGTVTRLTQHWRPRNTDNWSLAFNGNGTLRQDVVLEPTVLVEFDFVHGATVTQVVLRIHPETGHTAIPVGRPAISLVYYNLDNNSHIGLGTAVDPSSTVAEYETRHDITLNVNHVVDKEQGRLYRLVALGESQAHSIAGLRLLAVSVTQQIGVIDKGAG